MRTGGGSLLIFFNLFSVSPAARLRSVVNANVSYLHYDAHKESSDSSRTASLETLVAKQKLLLGVLVMRIAKLGLRVPALVFILFLGGYGTANAQLQTEESANSERTDESDRRRYTFTWQFEESGRLAPRGGTTKGPPVELDRSASPQFLAATDAEIETFERDRRAILAMAGNYRTSFDFIETIGFTADYRPPAPYQSWGTEFVTVVEESERFISLQHILVMRISLPSGEISEPIVMKHWRQDWTYEPAKITEFIGNQKWETRSLTPDSTRKKWLQSVYQVDDSPRYQSLGNWQHLQNYSSWKSDTTWRPLPRREFSVREDYDVLIGTNKHTINPTGWVQEEENLKVSLQASGEHHVLAKEVGLARYERISSWDWSEGHRYWSNTEPFWKEVRRQWSEEFSVGTNLQIKKDIDGMPLYAAMFRLALTTQTSDSKNMSEEIRKIIKKYTCRKDNGN